MKRTIDAEFIRWKADSRRRPLLLRGARQVGKTFTVRQFAQEHFPHYVELNFELHPELKSLFSSPDPQAIVRTMALTLNVTITPGQTLLFFDEIQECPQAITAMRYFYEQMPDLHVIGAGSLLDVTLRSADLRLPVGRIQYLYLRPLSFLEFLAALGEHPLAVYVSTLAVATVVPEAVHQKLLRLLAVRISQASLSLDEHVLSVPLYALGQLPALIRAAAAVE